MPQKLPRNTVAALLGLAVIAGSASHAGAPEVAMPEPKTTAFTAWVESRMVQQTFAAGLHLVRPILKRSDSVLLVEGYGYKGEGDLGLAGAGVIYRRRNNFEANFFFEGLQTEDGFAYPQVGVGASWAPTRWLTLRANGYIPLRNLSRDARGRDHGSYSERRGDEIVRTTWSRDRFLEREPMIGFDAEAEFRLPNPPSWVDPRLAIGYAYREASDRGRVAAGPLARLELHFGHHWKLEGEWRDDAASIRQEWRVGVGYQMSFGGGKEDDERFGPAQRFPWPTVSRGTEKGSLHRKESRTPAPSPEAPAPADDCCPSSAPLIFN